jgi:hypothetical protein
MKITRIAAIALTIATLPIGSLAAGRGGGARASGGFDFHGEAGGSHPQTASHSSTGPQGTNRTTTVNDTGNGYNRTTTATNGGYSRTSSGGASNNGNVYHSSSGSSPYGSHNSSTSGNYNTGNYNHNGNGSNYNGSYSTSGSGNYYNHTYSGSGTATNAWGQTYHSSTYANNGYVYHGYTVTNPVYHGYAAWGWNGGYAWYAAPSYWGGGFWGAFAIGATSAAVYGSIVAANNATYNSYQVASESPGAKLLESYHLTQTQCGPPNLVVVYGPNNSVICAYPNNVVSAGNYSVNPQTLTITSEKPAP